MTELKKTMNNLSDHQIMGMVEVMLSDDHSPAENTATYVTAYEIAVERGLIEETDTCG